MQTRQLKLGLLVSFATLLLPVSIWAQTSAKNTPSDRTLSVKLNYTGSGTVDEKHKIFVLVFDSNPFAAQILAEASSRPVATAPVSPNAPKTAYILARQSAATKNSTLLFKALRAPTVYVAAFFDQSGTYDGVNDPGHGSPSGIYGSKPGEPAPIALTDGKPTEVVVTFDDSVRIP